MELAEKTARMTGKHWLFLFAGILAAWGALYMMSVPAGLIAAGRSYGEGFWQSFCNITPDAAGFLRLALMWALMSAAMMAPTFIPALATYEQLSATTGRDFYALLAGYLLVWLGFSAAAAALQMGLARAALVSPIGQSQSDWLTVSLLTIAGLYQFSSLKEACLSKCRLPLTFYIERWTGSRFNALNMGLSLGLICLGCCWALMLLGFVGGVMNLLWMGLATVFMIFEKLPEIGRYLTRPMGVALIAAAGYFSGLTLGLL